MLLKRGLTKYFRRRGNYIMCFWINETGKAILEDPQNEIMNAENEHKRTSLTLICPWWSLLQKSNPSEIVIFSYFFFLL